MLRLYRTVFFLCFFCLFLFIQKFRILVIQILVKMKLNAKSLVLENMTASVLQEQVASTAKVTVYFLLYVYANFFPCHIYILYHTSV